MKVSIDSFGCYDSLQDWFNEVHEYVIKLQDDLHEGQKLGIFINEATRNEIQAMCSGLQGTISPVISEIQFKDRTIVHLIDDRGVGRYTFHFCIIQPFTNPYDKGVENE